MKLENPLAYSFIMQDDVFLLKNDKAFYDTPVVVEPEQTVPEVPAPVVETPVLRFNYFGKHKKSFLVISHYTDADFLHPNHFTALENTLKRLDYTMDDIAILNLANYPKATAEQLFTFFAAKKLLILGGQALPTDLEKPLLNKITLYSGAALLFTYSFNEMMDNNEYKKAFWEQMKQL